MTGRPFLGKLSAASLRSRFLIAILVWVALGIGGIWYSATSVFTRHIELQYHDELYGHVRELAGLVDVGKDGHIALTRPLSDPRYLEPMSGFYWQVTVDRGQTLRSASMRRGRLDDDVAHSPQVIHMVEGGPTGPAIMYGFTRLVPDGRVIHYVIATDKRYLDSAIAGFTRELTAWLMALAAALIGTGVLVIAFALRPLNRLGVAIAELRSGRREPLPGQFPSEISPLVDDLNIYIVENHAIIERARVAAGNLAHCLRTPLAIIADEAERLSEDPHGAAHGASLLRQCDIMVQQIDYHLARARSAAMAKTSGRTSLLPDIFTPLLSAMRKLHPDKVFDFKHPAGMQVNVAVDPMDLSELVSILLDNAGKWAKLRIAISLAENADKVSIRLADDGPGMTPKQMVDAFAIGTRFDSTKPGSGLGLAIARDIAEVYGIDLALEANPTGGITASLDVRATPH
ncbi:sensor histidine kinase [Novosphingobium sp. Fuku2-ISO-50]|uniref:sensor histidine kinase n=1 Tax=Novosphingobium sp. Fuku2-ISO-50 TaxID=1739114 RepID=UPI00076D2D9B|nr:HAMP domain-containing sensor histidine kinase [Novosphingobium sp. Fuku2-ISO-50]KUR75860.1 histidine kinase [Novosphingobium sp. Fuku2-ISO-50]